MLQREPFIRATSWSEAAGRGKRDAPRLPHPPTPLTVEKFRKFATTVRDIMHTFLRSLGKFHQTAQSVGTPGLADGGKGLGERACRSFKFCSCTECGKKQVKGELEK